MRQKSGRTKEPGENVIRDIRRATRRRFSAEEKIRIVLDGLRGADRCGAGLVGGDPIRAARILSFRLRYLYNRTPHATHRCGDNAGDRFYGTQCAPSAPMRQIAGIE